MVTKTVRRTLSGLTSVFAQGPKGQQGVAYTVKSAQQRADEAWRRGMHEVHSAPLRKDPKA